MKRAALAVVLALAAVTAHPMSAPPRDEAGRAEALRAKLDELRPRLERNAFGRPLHIDSSEAEERFRGEIHAVLRHPFARVSDALSTPASWCDVLTLPFNVQRCEARGDALAVYIGRKPEAPLEEATRLVLRFALAARGDDFLEVRLTADTGPVGTRDYHITFEAAPAGEGSTFVRMGYGYAHGVLSRLAMETYLATSGSGKVGFTPVGVDERGRPRLVGGIRGVTERNTMRYFLAIEAHLASVGAPPAERVRTRLEHWFDATEGYPRQLHEMPREDYLRLKLRRHLARR